MGLFGGMPSTGSLDLSIFSDTSAAKDLDRDW
jgi:hypothetical protein